MVLNSRDFDFAPTIERIKTVGAATFIGREERFAPAQIFPQGFPGRVSHAATTLLRLGDLPAFRAISDRRSGVNLSRRAFPPLRPILAKIFRSASVNLTALP